MTFKRGICRFSIILSFSSWRVDNNGDRWARLYLRIIVISLPHDGQGCTGTEADHGSPDEKDNEDDNNADDEDDNVISEHFE